MTDGMQIQTPRSRAVRRLLAVTAQQCQGSTLVVGEDEMGLVAACEAHGLEAVAVGAGPAQHGWAAEVAHKLDRAIARTAGSVDSSDEATTSPCTVVLDRVLQRLETAQAHEVLDAAWSALSPGGRLVVIVPHRGCGEDEMAVVRYGRRQLHRLLRPLGKPRLVSTQPYRWLLMVLERPRAGMPPLRRVLRDRFAVTVKQCRGRVLELGCGAGRLSRAIADAGHEVVGVDLNREKVEQARRDHPDIVFHHADILEVDLPTAAFDTVVLAEVLEHVPAEVGDRMLDRAWGWLRAGGRMVVSVPNEDLVPHRNHVREFDRCRLRQSLRRWGRTRTVTDQPLKWLMMVTEKDGR